MSASPTGGRSAKVTVAAGNERYKVEAETAAYSTRGRWSKDGGFEAKWPGLGAVDVTFEQAKVHRWRSEGPTGCSDETMTIRKGVFRGPISFGGKGGFTVAHRRSAPGQIREISPGVCHKKDHVEPAAEPPPAEPTTSIRDAYLYTYGRSGGAAITFSADGPLESGGGILPPIAFEATYAAQRRGMQVLAGTWVYGPSNGFLVPAPAGALTDATVEPPAPFAGTAVYHLESPTVASWTGDLNIAFPGVGTVPLAFPDISTRLCEGFDTCSGAPAPPAG
jgi:hypothetical protein